MTTAVLFLLLMLSISRPAYLQNLSTADLERFNATIDGAKAKISSAEYFYLDDSSPGDYFDNITAAAKVLEGILYKMICALTDNTLQPTEDETEQIVLAFADFFKEASLKTSDQGTPFGKRECRLLPKQFRNCRVSRVLEVASDYMQQRMMEYARANGFEGVNENNCLHLFVARFTQSSHAVRMFKASLDKYLLATTTVHAFCTVFRRNQSEEGNRDKAVQAQTTLAKSLTRFQLNDSVPWACDNAQAKVDADMAGVDVARLSEIINKAKGKVSSNDYFFDDSSAAEYFDSLSTAAGYLAVAQKATTTDQVSKKRRVITETFTSLFRDFSSTTDEHAAPFGLQECWILPAEFTNFTVVPIISTSLEAMQTALGGYDGMVKACEASNIDDTLKTLRDLIGNDCEKAPGHTGTMDAAYVPVGFIKLTKNALHRLQQSMTRYAEEHEFRGGSENKCLHLFAARFTKSEEAVQMFKKSFDKYLLASIAVQAVCTAFTPKCNEEAYRKNVLDTHASFAASLARTASIQLNDTTPWKCDDNQPVIISNMNATCERVKSTAASETYFLGELTAEEFENVTFGTGAAMAISTAEIFRSFLSATTPRKREVFKRTLWALFDELMDLMSHLANVRSDLSIPFGEKDDGLLPPNLKLLAACHPARKSAVFPVYELLTKVQENLRSTRDFLDEDDSQTLNVCQGIDTENLLKELNEFIAPGCQRRSLNPFGYASGWRIVLLEYAITHGFDGCDDNECLHIFIARYTNHSQDALEKLHHSLDKYVYILVFLKSFCESFHADTLRNTTIEVVDSLKDGMGFSSHPGNMQPCDRATTTNPNHEAEASEPIATKTTTREVDDAWPEKVTAYAKDVIDAQMDHLKPRTWKARQILHEAVAKGIVGRLSEFLDKAHSFVALAYLPYADDERHGFLKLPSDTDVVRSEYNSVSYVASRRSNAGLNSSITSQWDTIKNKAPNILEATFSTRANNLTSRMEEVGERFGPFVAEDGFRAVVALRCGYEFVWYQLGYRYFPAGYSTSKYTLFTDSDNKYSDKCGQIVFFP